MAVADTTQIPDLWASVGYAELPGELVTAFQTQDWSNVRQELSKVMDGAITDGAYGRELLQLVLALPRGIDPVFDRYRAAAMLDHGDWDGLRTSLAGPLVESIEVRGVREILTAPFDRTRLPEALEQHHTMLFEIYEYQARRAMGPYRRWAQRIGTFYPDVLWTRQDVALGRHLRYRRLSDTVLLAVGEAHAGRLDVAYALAREGQRLGDEGEPLRVVGADLADGLRAAMGYDAEGRFEFRRVASSPTGPSPYGTWEMLMDLMPFLTFRKDDALAWASRLCERIGARLGAPRLEYQSATWRVASDLATAKSWRDTELAGLLAKARHAAPGLTALPTFLVGCAERRYDAFRDAEVLARRSGNVWLQVAALAWMTALDPSAVVAHRLRVLLEVTGWRRLILTPSEIAADAALGATTLGERSEAILEMAIVAGRSTITTEVVARYVDDPTLPTPVRTSAVNALARVGTVHAREILARLARRTDDVGRTAARLGARTGGIGLSEREIEVLSLAADGLTNKQIGEKLFLSPHTIARHLANARVKLGASNRAEAAVRLHRAGTD